MKGIFISFIFIFNLLTVHAQNRMDIAINNLEENYAQEKVYILFDKEQYAAGDNMHFQSFVFDDYHLSSISKTLYVELYDQNKNLLDKKVLLINKGQCSGSFNLNNTLNEDVYFVRAYTNWMANFDSEWHFLKPIPIYNQTSKKKLVLSGRSSWSVKALPEGGTFVDQVATKVSVRLYSQGKSPKLWNGYVVDSEFPDTKIQSFKGIDENVALFSMTPKSGKIYKIVVEDDQGNYQHYTLPAVAKRGVNLKVESEKYGIRYSITATNMDKNMQNYSIIGTINNQLAYKATIKSADNKVSSLIPTKEIEQNGIMQISIFDERDNVLAQRLCYLDHNNFNQNNIVLENLNFNNNPRDLNSFEIKQNSNDSNYTLLIKDATDTDILAKDNFVSSLFLSEDFRSPIYNPAQYFSPTANPEALDALLISEKWERFDWRKVITGQKPLIKYNLNDNQFISYKARLALNSRPLANTVVNLVFKNNSGEPLLSQMTTDQNGDFFINNLNFEDSYFVNYFLNTNDKQQANLTLKLRPVIESNIAKLNFNQNTYELRAVYDNYALPSSIQKALITAENNQKMSNDETLIEEVKIVKKKSDAVKKLNNELTSGMFSTMNATVFDFVNDNQDAFFYRGILEWLQGRVPGLSMMMVDPGNYMPVIRGVEAGMFLDEMNVDVNAIQSINVDDIAMIKVVKGSRLIGSSILVYTRPATMKSPISRASSINNKVEIKAYDKPAVFQTINYSQEKYRGLVSDWRQVLYWNPNFSASKETNSKVSFINNDNAKNREITIIGYDKNDKLYYYNEIVK